MFLVMNEGFATLLHPPPFLCWNGGGGVWIGGDDVAVFNLHNQEARLGMHEGRGGGTFSSVHSIKLVANLRRDTGVKRECSAATAASRLGLREQHQAGQRCPWAARALCTAAVCLEMLLLPFCFACLLEMAQGFCRDNSWLFSWAAL